MSELKTRAKDEADYGKFWENFGVVLKEGVWDDAEHRGEIAPLLRFRHLTEDGWTSLSDYINRMQAGQETIYYLAGDEIDALRASPQLEGFRAKGLDVLLLTDSIDAFWPDRLGSFEGKRLASVTQSATDLDKDAGPAGHFRADQRDESGAGGCGVGCARDGTVNRQRRGAGGKREGAGPADAAAAAALGACRGAGRTGAGGESYHKLIAALAAKAEDKDVVAEASATLLDLARVQEGDLPRDASGFARRITALMAAGLKSAG